VGALSLRARKGRFKPWQAPVGHGTAAKIIPGAPKPWDDSRLSCRDEKARDQSNYPNASAGTGSSPTRAAWPGLKDPLLAHPNMHGADLPVGSGLNQFDAAAHGVEALPWLPNWVTTLEPEARFRNSQHLGNGVSERFLAEDMLVERQRRPGRPGRASDRAWR